MTIIVEGPLEPGRYRLVADPEPQPEPSLHPVRAYSQRDPQWAALPLGASRYTMGSAGCAVTAATMVATVIDPELTPGDVARWLNAHGGFTSGGLLYWAKVAEMVDGLEWVDYHIWRKIPADVDQLRQALSRNPQVVQVDFHPGGALDTHFVTALAMTPDGGDVEIIDPWTGQRGTLLSVYGAPGWDLQRAVYALAEFRVQG